MTRGATHFFFFKFILPLSFFISKITHPHIISPIHSCLLQKCDLHRILKSQWKLLISCQANGFFRFLIKPHRCNGASTNATHFSTLTHNFFFSLAYCEMAYLRISVRVAQKFKNKTQKKQKIKQKLTTIKAECQMSG